MEGRIFSVETMGLVDGPGIRCVVFFQGCGIRCAFCHNPESHEAFGGELVSSAELFKKIKRFAPYFKRSGGGVTFSGGEPLLQPDFLLEMLRLCKEEGIHTCIDTSGVGLGDYDEILQNTDLVLYDVKAIEPKGYKKICGGDISKTEEFQRAMVKNNSVVTVRQVIIPGINDSEQYMKNLKQYIKANIPGARKVELLSYHLMGIHKYKELGIKYPLDGVEAMDKEKTAEFQAEFF